MGWPGLVEELEAESLESHQYSLCVRSSEPESSSPDLDDCVAGTYIKGFCGTMMEGDACGWEIRSER